MPPWRSSSSTSLEEIELRAGDRIRWTRNDTGLGLVNSRTAEVLTVANGRVTFRLEDGKTLELGRNDPQLRHVDHAWASTVHAFQGRTVDNVIAAMEARHPHLTTQKSFYVEISRARDRAELVTDDAAELRTQLQEATGERIAALEGIGELPRHEPGKAADHAATAGRDRETAAPGGGSRTERGAEEGAGNARQSPKSPSQEQQAPVRERGKGGMDLGL
ncbi:MAG: ATP-binding domain-containing protein [Defluviicoccus sp.]|nr:ATP-binding domain-containing protein [Defluviicoccus sp.]